MNEMLHTESSTFDPISKERAAITESAKTHIRILRGELLYLHATGPLPAPLTPLLPTLLSTIQNTAPTDPPHDILPVPLQIHTHTAYTGPTNTHIIALAADVLTVFAYLPSSSQAVAFNPRNRTAGLVPTKVLNLIAEGVPFTESRLCVAKAKGGGGSEVDYAAVRWEAGTHLRIWACKEDYGLIKGFGFNLATGEAGRFFAKARDVEFVEE